MPPINIKPDNYYLSIWFCEWEQGNILACAWRNAGTFKYEGAFRFKEKLTNKMTWYTVKIPLDSDCDIADAFESLFRVTSLKYFCDVTEVPIDGYGPKAWEVFRSVPFTNVSDKEGIERPLKH